MTPAQVTREVTGADLRPGMVTMKLGRDGEFKPDEVLSTPILDTFSCLGRHFVARKHGTKTHRIVCFEATAVITIQE